MRSVSIRQFDMKQATIPLGFEGENEFTEVRIDCKKTFDQHPNAVPSMTVTDPAGNKYPAVVTRDGDIVVWQLTAGDLTTKGYGEIQIEFVIDGTVIGKTDIARTRIERSIFPDGEAPEPMQNWLDEANQTLAEVEEAKQAFPTGGTTGQVLTKKSDEDYDTEWKTPQSGGGGTSNYNNLDNKPSINGVTLSGNKSLSDLSIPSQEDVDAKYTKPQGGIPASDIDPSAIPSPTSIIDDNAGEGDTEKVLSADKVTEITDGLKEAITSIPPQNLQIIAGEYAPNLIDESAITEGIYIAKNGSVSEVSYYQATDYIPVEAGEKYYFTWKYGNDRTNGNIRFIACYDSTKTIIPSAGSDTAIETFPMTIPAGVSFVRLSFALDERFYSKYQFEKGEVPTPYYEYGTWLGGKVKDEFIPDVSMGQIPAFHLVDGQNLLNPNDPDYATGKFMETSGNLSNNADYVSTGYIAVKPGDYIIASYLAGGGTSQVNMRTVACFDSSKTAQGTKGAYSVNDFTVPSGIAFIRVCYSSGTYGTNVQIQRLQPGQSFSPYKAYEDPHYELKPEYMFPIPNAPEYVYLPSDLYVAVGRTIELYNEQIVANADKYHFMWYDNVAGNAYERKFSITGTNALIGTHLLQLQLYDDELNLVYVGGCTIHVVAASNPEVKIIPIGDSLTNWKAWLQETMLLSSQNIEWIGTRYSGLSYDSEGNEYASGTIHHEGRSGWGAYEYLRNSSYTMDTNYDGVPGVLPSENPFWDGTKFSLNHYLTVQTGVDTPDAVQIFLGTNDLASHSVEDSISNIVAMVESIRGEYANLPIFVCNTIFRSNQNGYGATGTSAYTTNTGSTRFKYNEDVKVIELMKGLREALAGKSGVYLIPLASCMDREYSFGQVATKVNPRSDIEINMPSESVHPQNVGYYQMADLLYSTYCGLMS